jgi:hypothetical protein
MFGPPPSAGTFTYDASTQIFTDFSVTWDGLDFNLTSAANSPIIVAGGLSCLGGLTGGALGFALLDGACDNTTWTGSNIFNQPTGPYFQFTAGSGNPSVVIYDTLSSSIPQDGTMAMGSFTITATVPEPSTRILASTVLLASLAFVARKRIARP